MNKMNKTILSVCGLALALAAFSSCSNADYKPLDNAVYIHGAAADPLRTLTIGDNEVSTELLIRTAAPVAQPVKVQLSVDKAALEAYNKRYDASYELLPAEFYTLSATELTIEPGRVSAPALTVKIKPFSAELQKSGKKYAVPVYISSVTGADFAPQAAERTFVVACDQVIKTKAIKLEPTQGMRVMRPEGIQTNTWTVEMRIKSDDIRQRYNNQSFMGFGSGIPGGGEGSGFIFGRWEGEALQFKINGHDGINATVKPESNKWYHVAIVCDAGTVRLYVNGQPSGEFQNAKFAIKAQYKEFALAYPRSATHPYRRSSYYMSEVRFWNVVRTASQIRQNRYAVDPKTPGLMAYWKLDDGAGTSFKEYTGKTPALELYSSNQNLTSHWVDIRSDQD